MTNLLVPIDFSDVTPAVLQTATRLANALSAHLYLLHVSKPEPALQSSGSWRPVDVVGMKHPAHVDDQAHMAHRTVYVPPSEAADARNIPTLLQQQVDRLRIQGHAVSPVLISGKPVDCILEQAALLQPDFIVLGSHGHGALHHLLLGSVAEAVLRKASCPVVIVPARLAQSA